jgi:hypothetical protein
MDSYHFGSRIRIKFESWIRIVLKIQKLFKLNMELWRAVDANSGGVEAQNGAVEGL